MTGLGAGGGAMEMYEAEKKYKRNLEVLKTEIQDKNREIEGLKKDVKDSNDRHTRLVEDNRKLEQRLINNNSKPPQVTNYEEMANSVKQENQELKDQLFVLQRENQDLQTNVKESNQKEIVNLKKQLENMKTMN
jgi:predicted  nucleic acid-binding Zn-ribbon protein